METSKFNKMQVHCTNLEHKGLKVLHRPYNHYDNNNDPTYSAFLGFAKAQNFATPDLITYCILNSIFGMFDALNSYYLHPKWGNKIMFSENHFPNTFTLCFHLFHLFMLMMQL